MLALDRAQHLFIKLKGKEGGFTAASVAAGTAGAPVARRSSAAGSSVPPPAAASSEGNRAWSFCFTCKSSSVAGPLGSAATASCCNRLHFERSVKVATLSWGGRARKLSTKFAPPFPVIGVKRARTVSRAAI